MEYKMWLARMLVLGLLLGGLGAGASASAAGGGPIGGDFGISNDTPTEVGATLVYNLLREEYLVVWYNDRAGYDDIRAQRVSRGGALLGGSFYISAGCDENRQNSDIAYNNAQDQYLVVWEQYEPSEGYSIQARRVPGAGAVVDSADIAIRGSGYNTYTPRKPAVAYASISERYLVAWAETWHPLPISYEIAGQVVTGGGALEGGVLSISLGADSREAPDLAYNSSRNEFLVVWEETVVGDIDVYGRRVRMTGGAGALDSAFPIANFAAVDETAAAVAAIPTIPNEGQYLVTWQANENIYACTVSGDGNTLGSWQTLVDTSWGEYRPAVAGNRNNQQFLVTWTGIPMVTPPAMMQVQGRTLALDGTILDDITLIGGKQVFDSAVAAGALGDYLVVFDDNEVAGTSDRGIYGVLWGLRVYLPLVLR